MGERGLGGTRPGQQPPGQAVAGIGGGRTEAVGQRRRVHNRLTVDPTSSLHKGPEAGPVAGVELRARRHVGLTGLPPPGPVGHAGGTQQTLFHEGQNVVGPPRRRQLPAHDLAEHLKGRGPVAEDTGCAGEGLGDRGGIGPRPSDRTPADAGGQAQQGPDRRPAPDRVVTPFAEGVRTGFVEGQKAVLHHGSGQDSAETLGPAGQFMGRAGAGPRIVLEQNPTALHHQQGDPASPGGVGRGGTVVRRLGPAARRCGDQRRRSCQNAAPVDLHGPLHHRFRDQTTGGRPIRRQSRRGQASRAAAH